MKKILILGANNTETTIVNAAKEMGVYTIVTDNHDDWDLSPAKKHADEAWNVSWSDIDTLEDLCRKNAVSGVIAGFSEFRVDCMIQLCERLHLPCSITKDQLEITRDKKKFKELCRQYDLSCIHEYDLDSCNSFPVIIKPVDRAGSIGINVAYDKSQLEEFYKIALSLSPTKNVIIEDFIRDGFKFDVYYYVQDSIPFLLGTSDTIMCKGAEGAEFLQKAWTFPSNVEKEFIEKCDRKIQQLLVGIGIHDCYVTMSAFYHKNDFYFFEAGFRLSGDMSFNYYEGKTGINYEKTMIAYSLGMEMAERFLSFEQTKPLKSVILNVFGKNGKINKIALPDLSLCPSRIIQNTYVKEGDLIQNRTKVLKKIAMFTIMSSNEDDLRSSIDFINNNVKFEDMACQDLIYEKVIDSDMNGLYNV